ncbi:hypothetical protein [Pseudacidovorax intermedius]|uniref:hypothetical protein n=1 Tax=Pseudacidovorax intermedius TaxID=433924 RepID=UPI00187CB2BA|nr:hypothetical protein [Pseudacidovorax intermedius]
MPDPKTEAEVTALIEQLGACLNGQHHHVGLSALLTLYRACSTPAARSPLRTRP